MANVFDSNVWTLDTAAAIWDYTTKGPIALRKLLWKPSAAGQTLKIAETDGGLIWESTSLAATPAGDQIMEFWDTGKWFDGMTLTTLTAGGKLYVWPE